MLTLCSLSLLVLLLPLFLLMPMSTWLPASSNPHYCRNPCALSSHCILLHENTIVSSEYSKDFCLIWHLSRSPFSAREKEEFWQCSLLLNRVRILWGLKSSTHFLCWRLEGCSMVWAGASKQDHLSQSKNSACTMLCIQKQSPYVHS